MSVHVLFLSVAVAATPTPTPVPPAAAGPFGGRRLDVARPRPTDVIDDHRLGRLAAAGRVEQPAAAATPRPEPEDDAIWRELAARADAAAEARDRWRSRLEDALVAAGEAEASVTVAEADVGAAWIAYLREKKPERRELVLAPRLEVAKGRLAAARQRLALARGEVDAIRRDARRAGIPPGWLRDLAERPQRR